MNWESTKAKVVHQTPGEIVDFFRSSVRIGVDKLYPASIPFAWELPEIVFSVDSLEMRKPRFDCDRELIYIDPFRGEVYFKLLREDVVVHELNGAGQVARCLNRGNE